jgi:hypothetical protein
MSFLQKVLQFYKQCDVLIIVEVKTILENGRRILKDLLRLLTSSLNLHLYSEEQDSVLGPQRVCFNCRQFRVGKKITEMHNMHKQIFE